MKELLATSSLLLFVGIPFMIPVTGGPAVLLCGVCALVVCFIINRAESDREFLLQLFVGALLVRVMLASAIYFLRLQDFFGGDALTYDIQGDLVTQVWQGQVAEKEFARARLTNFLGMPYLVAAIYTIVGRNSLAVQFFNAVLGAATPVVIYVCSQRIFKNRRVAQLAALLVAFYPSL
ncbi:MAG TPA: glycosyltransferase family 39 protein, partial [Pyrinomonadaceae bacterium]